MKIQHYTLTLYRSLIPINTTIAFDFIKKITERQTQESKCSEERYKASRELTVNQRDLNTE